MNRKAQVFVGRAILAIVAWFSTQRIAAQAHNGDDNPDVHPPVTRADVQIVKRAREILGSPSKWNRADNRVCPADAKTFSLYCALEKATVEVRGKFEHRGAAMQEARFVVEELAPGKNYHHRLMDYNNDPTTTFADVGKFFVRLESHLNARLGQTK